MRITAQFASSEQANPPANPVEVIEKPVDASPKPPTSVQDRGTPDAIRNVPENIVHSELHAKLIIPKNHSFVMFPTKVNANHLGELLIAIRECDAIREVLRRRYLEIRNFSFGEWA